MLVPLVTAPDASRSTAGHAAPSAASPPDARAAPAARQAQAFDAVLAVATGLLDCRVAMLWVAEASRLRLVASRNGEADSVSVNQDARLYAGLFDGGEQAVLDLAPGRRAYVHLARGQLDVNGDTLTEGDGLKLADLTEIRLEKGRDAEVLVFDLP